MQLSLPKNIQMKLCFFPPMSSKVPLMGSENKVHSNVHLEGQSLRYKSRMAFTLIELLVTIAIIAILATLLTSILSAMRTSASSAKTIQSIRTLQSALTRYASDHNGLMLSPYWEPSPGFVLSWGNALSHLGYVPDEGMNNTRYKPLGHFGNRWDNITNETLRRRYPKASNSGGFALNNGARRYAELWVQKPVALVRQPSKTVLVSDAPIYPGGDGFFEWFIMDGADYKAFPSSLVNGSAFYGFVDGHVAQIKAEKPGLLQSKPLNYGTEIRFNFD